MKNLAGVILGAISGLMTALLLLYILSQCNPLDSGQHPTVLLSPDTAKQPPKMEILSGWSDDKKFEATMLRYVMIEGRKYVEFQSRYSSGFIPASDSSPASAKSMTAELEK